ncbi:MAG TPA: hypothetical protein VKG61_08970 [Streptosporangiaceae bacterium]|nr:hypothetical protein [Streptosporangiaceae bacterium]
MERLDNAATGLIEQDVRERFPDGAVDSVAVLQYGDDPSVEPGQIVIQVTVASAAEAEGDEDLLRDFHRAYGDTIRQLQQDIPQRWPQANRFKLVTRQSEGRQRLMMLRIPAPDEPKGDLTPVMARLGPADLETLDTLIAAGFAANRAQAVRWALARIRERPAYTELREHAKQIETLKSQF